MSDGKKQTAVNWLVKQIKNKKGLVDLDIQAAKSMERQQIATAYDKADYEPVRFDSGEQYYNETYDND